MKAAVKEYERSTDLPRWSDKYEGEDWARVPVESNENVGEQMIAESVPAGIAARVKSINEQTTTENPTTANTMNENKSAGGDVDIEEEMDDCLNYDCDHIEY
ncbi:hypothetical protein ACA910_013905 [Epithemia clementina (nom. ined.)]